MPLGGCLVRHSLLFLPSGHPRPLGRPSLPRGKGPYLGRGAGRCQAVCPQNDEEAMVEAVALYNPVSFAFEVTRDFMMYRKGVYSR